MGNNESQFKGFTLLEIILLIVLVTVVIGASYLAFIRVNAKTSANLDTCNDEICETALSQNNKDVARRDNERRNHAATMASSLFASTLYGKGPSVDQKGLNGLQKDLIDPKTGNKYVFNPVQNTMELGDAIFALNATCDSKTTGSKRAGMIVNSPSGSVALAIKLESAGYACESSL